MKSSIVAFVFLLGLGLIDYALYLAWKPLVYAFPGCLLVFWALMSAPGKNESR